MQILGQRLLHLLAPDLPATVKTSNFKGSKAEPCSLQAYSRQTRSVRSVCGILRDKNRIWPPPAPGEPRVKSGPRGTLQLFDVVWPFNLS